MRREDQTRLAQPYGQRLGSSERDLASALGMATPSLDRLTDEILADFDTTDTTYGIGWWAPHPGTSRRILISDQLYACATSIATNLVEAELHRLELLDYSDQVSDLLANSVQAVGDQLVVRMPPRLSGSEDALDKLQTLHIVGSARALSASLDCLGGTVIGVLALRSNLLKSDLDSARKVLRALQQDGSEGRSRQIAAGSALETEIHDAGPEGWLPWVLGLRNMLVHRGRRISVAQLVPREPVLLDFRGRPIPRMNVIQQLPRDAGRSEIEVFLDPEAPVLTEDAIKTITGVLGSTHRLVERAAERLLEVWQWRRAHPAELAQPREQWPAGVTPQEVAFRGYAEGTFPYDPSLITGNPVLHRRMIAACLPDPVRNRWAGFD